MTRPFSNISKVPLVTVFLVVFTILVPVSIVLAADMGYLLPILVLGGLTAVPLVLKKPEWVIYFLIVFIPVEEFLEKFIPRGVIYETVRFGSEALLYLLLAYTLIYKLRRGTPWFRTPIDFPLFLFIIFAIVSGFINATPPTIWLLGLRPLIRYIAVFFILTQLQVSPSFFTRCFKLSLIVGVIVSSIGLLQTLIGYPLTNLLIPGDVIVGDTVTRIGLRHAVPPRTYIFSTMGRYDTFGVYLMFLLNLGVVALTFTRNDPIRRNILLLLLLGFPALALTFSRQSWIGFAIALTVVLIFSRRKEFQRTKLFYALLAMLGILFIWVLVPYARYFSAAAIGEASLLDRILEPFSARYLEVSRFSFGRLFVIFEVGPRLLSIAPLFGLGPGQFGSLAAGYFNIPFYEIIDIPASAAPYVSDVNWVVILGQTGVLGVLTFAWIYLRLFTGALRRFRSWPRGLAKGTALGYAGGIAAILVLGFLGPNFEVRQISFYIWLWGGLIIGLQVKSGRREKVSSQ